MTVVEKFHARAVSSEGKILGEWTHTTIARAMDAADVNEPDAAHVTVRGERQADGTYSGVGLGRVVATRETRKLADGTVCRAWLID